jgi:DNA-binding transcriptional MocR family regulator
LPENIDALEVHRAALAKNISVAPGPMFSAQRKYCNYIRLNYGHIWSEEIEKAIEEVGKIVSGLNSKTNRTVKNLCLPNDA